MSKLVKTFLVTILAVSMMIMGPLSAIAISGPVDPSEPPMTFSSEDMTAGYSAEVGADVAEITAIGNSYYDGRTLIAGLDANGEILLADWDGSQFNDWTGAWNSYVENYYGSEWTRITSIVYFESDYIIGGTRLVDGVEEATIVSLCGSCYPVFNDTVLFDDPTLTNHSAVTGMAYDADSDKLGITVSGSAGLIVWDNASDYYDDFREIDETIMTGATAPIALYGNSVFNPVGTISDEAERPVSSALADTVKTLAYPSYWAMGTGTGSVLAMGSSDLSEIGAQTLTTPGAGQVFSLDYDWTDGAWLVGVAGSDGVMNLFMDDTIPAFTTATIPAPVTTDLNFPATISANADGEFVGPYYLVGGTGVDGAHLYKWKQTSAEFIDFDYLVDGMSKINCVAVDYSTSVSVNRLIDEHFFVGGSKLLLLTETPMFDVEPNPANSDSSAECGDGSASVEVPENAIGVEYNLLVEKVASGTPAVPGGLSLLGNSYEFECFDSNGLPITEFAADVTITIHYDEADLNGMSEDSLVIYWYNTETAAWEAVVPSVVDAVNNTVTITVNHFSQFGILGVTATALPYTGS